MLESGNLKPNQTDTETKTDYKADPLYIALKAALYAALATPLLVWSAFLFPFITPKALFFRTIIELALVLYIPLAFKYPELRPKWSLVTKAVWLYMAVIVTSSAFGVDFSKSFWGTIERGEGILTILHFAVYFTILPAILRTWKEWFWYLFAAAVSVFLVAAAGLTQFFGSSLFPAQGDRVSGTIGNAAFFSAVMIFGIVIDIYLIWQSKRAEASDNSLLRGCLWIFLGVELFNLYHAQTRGALIALAAAAALFAAVAIFKSQSRGKKILSAGAIALIILAGVGIYALRDTDFIKSQSALLRLASISPENITTQSRLDTWQASWQGFTDRPILGYGYENYDIAFNRYFPARIYKDAGSQVWFDRAHNVFFDILLTSGAVGLLSYLFIFAAAGAVLYKLFKEHISDNRWHYSALLGAGLGAYFLQNLFVFDTHATYLLFYLLLAHIVFLRSEYLAPPQEAEREIPARKSYSFGFGMIIAVFALFFFSFYHFNWKPAQAAMNTIDAIMASAVGEYHSVKPNFEAALERGTYMNQEIRQRMPDYIFASITKGGFSEGKNAEYYSFLLSELRKNIEEHPLDVKNYLYLINAINRGSPDETLPDEAAELGKRALELSPARPQIYFELAQVEFTRGNNDKGLSYLEQGVAVNPEPRESQMNYLLGAIIAGREDIAKTQKERFERRGHVLTADDFAAIAGAYRQSGDARKAIEYYRMAVRENPDDINLRTRLAREYGEVCELESARAQLGEIAAMSPDLAPEADAFYLSLAEKCEM